MAGEPEQTQFTNESSSDDEFFDTSTDLTPKSESKEDNVDSDCSTTHELNKEETENTEKVPPHFSDSLGSAAVLSTDKIRDNLVDKAGSDNGSQSLSSESVESKEESESSSNLPVNQETDETGKKTTDRLEHDEDSDSSATSEDVNEGGDHTAREDKMSEEHEGLAAEGAEPDEDDGGVVIDEDGEEVLKKLEETLTLEEKEKRKEEAQALKKEGNDLFKDEEYPDAVYKYTEAIKLCPLSFKKERSIMYANRAACKIHMKQLEEGVKDCTKALDLHPHYMKVLLRRAQTYELLEKLEEALADYQRALEMDPGCHVARVACMRLPDEIKEKNEKLKAEMMEKLKDLGNMVLRPFGLSTDNFQMQQDPISGSYSVNFVQNTKNNGK